MNSLIQQSKYFKSTSYKIAMALAFASVISSLSIAPAFADDDGHDRHGNQGRHGQREWRGDRGNYGYREDYGYRSEYRQPYIYAQPVYVPPPVYYEPRQSPGISLFFPLDLRR